jgi:hypothetical protein
MSSRENLEARRARLMRRVRSLDTKIAEMDNKHVAKSLDAAAAHATVYTGVPADGCKTVLILLRGFGDGEDDDFTPFEYVEFIFNKLSDHSTPQVLDATETEPNPAAECVMTMTLTLRYEMDEFILRDYFKKTSGTIDFVMAGKSGTGLPVVKFYRFNED